MKVEVVFVQDRRLWVRLCEKGGKRPEMPRHHNLEAYLHAYLDGSGISAGPKGPLFRTIGRTNGGTLKKAAAMANHASTRTTQLYDPRHDEVNLDEVERISI